MPADDRYSSLPFSTSKQKAVLGHLLTNDQFFKQAKHTVEAGWFADVVAQRVWDLAKKFDAEHGRKPTISELREYKELRKFDGKEVAPMQLFIQASSEAMGEFKLDALSKELTEWHHGRILHGAITKAANLYNSQEMDKAHQVVKAAAKEIDTTTFYGDEAVNFEEFRKTFAHLDTEIDGALGFGLSAVDKNLHSLATDSGLLRGDNTIILAPTNLGKTSCMITVVVHNVLRGKDVLLLTHQGRPDDIQEKLWCCALNRTKAELRMILKDQSGLGDKILQPLLAKFSRHLKYVPVMKPGTTVEQVYSLICRENEKRRAVYGKGFDLVVDDYPALLSTSMARGGKMGIREIWESVYTYFEQMALDEGFHALTAIQGNRKAAEMNKKRADHHRLLDMEDVAECYGAMSHAVNVITLNADEQAMAKNVITFKICKSRASKAGVAVMATSNYASSRTHGDDLGPAIWYRGGGSMADRAESLLTQYAGSELPLFEVLGGGAHKEVA